MLENHTIFTLRITRCEHYQASVSTGPFHLLFSNIHYDSPKNSLCHKYLDQDALYCIPKLGVAVLLSSELQTAGGERHQIVAAFLSLRPRRACLRAHLGKTLLAPWNKSPSLRLTKHRWLPKTSSTTKYYAVALNRLLFIYSLFSPPFHMHALV